MGVKHTCLKVEIEHKEIEGPQRGKESFRVFSCDSLGGRRKILLTLRTPK